MILSDQAILLAIERGMIGLAPCPPRGDRRWSPTTVDLTLDAEIRVWKPATAATDKDVVDPMAPGYDTTRLISEDTLLANCASGLIVEPGDFVLGWTVERLRLPHESRIGARVEGKSSLARIGVIVHLTAPIIHPGFGATSPDSSAPIQLEIKNHGTRRVRLTQGMPICQLMFEQVHGDFESGGYRGQFAMQGPTTGSGATASGP